jgi:cation diffusion facilitator CzcD-associated flavoprotein CzcO
VPTEPHTVVSGRDLIARHGGSVRIVIIGAGPGGLCMGVKLLKAGFQDFVIVERGGGVGGTWRRNTYPGAACDVQSALYSFSFEVKTDWSRPYAPQPEILTYMEGVAEKYGLFPHCRFNTEVLGIVWDDATETWTVRMSGNETLTADVVVSAIGMFNELVRPDLPGLDRFAGTVFHSAEWAWDHDLQRERVAVVGSAASAVQLVPEIVKRAKQVYLFQRTANWVLPKQDTPYTEEELDRFHSDPSVFDAVRDEVLQRVERNMTFSDPETVAASQAAAEAALETVVDPVVRRRLRPSHPWGCKRPLFSNDFYPAFNRPNLELVTEPISHLTEDAIVTSDGTARQAGTVILATGFSATRYLSAIDVVGRQGVHIDEAWRDGATAYLGVTTAGFPNLFMLYGPNTNNGSILTMIEAQADHVIDHLRRLVEGRLAWIDVKPEAMERYNIEIQKGIESVKVWQASCNGYYRSASGRVVTQWPFTMAEFRRRCEGVDWSDYLVSSASRGDLEPEGVA